MNKRVLTILLTAFVIAAGCSYLVYRIVGNRILTGSQKTTQVVVASQDVPLGSILRDVDLGTVEISGALPKGAIVDKKEAINRGVISSLYQGEPILESRLAAPGSGGGLASTIPPGMRACAVKVDEVVGVAGFVTPGMHVDVLISGNPPGSVDVNTMNGPKVKTLLQDISVLSAGTDIQRDVDGKPQQVQVVNLLVTPEQAEQLSLASNQTKIQLVLRNPIDTKIVEPPGTVVANLYADKNAPPTVKPRSTAAAAPRAAPKPAAPAVYVIKVFNGSKQTEEKFAPGEEKQ
ncbi:MAG TPA: Flp pilus assembly protein CpaB [Acidobacteriaceae bacterium]|jgi:pilus assembly protein CpaB